MQEVLLYFPDSCPDIRPTAKIEDVHVLRDIATKCGYKVRYIAAPSEEKHEVVSYTRQRILCEC